MKHLVPVPSPEHLRKPASTAPRVAGLLILSATAAAADPPAHAWGQVNWGMTAAQVRGAYGNTIVEVAHAPNQRRTEMAELLRLKNDVTINGIALSASFGFSRASGKLDRVILRANLPEASTAACHAAYARIRQAETSQMQAPKEEKPGLRSVRAIWQSATADTLLSEMQVTGRCFVSLVIKRPGVIAPAG